MNILDLQTRCELGQDQLERQEYLEAESTFAEVERLAWKQREWDTLARVYMPLQEARRQRRQRCAEGVVYLDLLAEGPDDLIQAQHVLENYPQGQLLIGGWGTLEPAIQVRKLQAKHGLYLETFLAAVYPLNQGHAVVIAPLADTFLPPAQPYAWEELGDQVPPRCILLKAAELPAGPQRNSSLLCARVMSLWEQLHRPFLEFADHQSDPIRRIEEYRRTIQVDYACELAHQRIADTARELARCAPVGV